MDFRQGLLGYSRANRIHDDLDRSDGGTRGISPSSDPLLEQMFYAGLDVARDFITLPIRLRRGIDDHEAQGHVWRERPPIGATDPQRVLPSSTQNGVASVITS